MPSLADTIDSIGPAADGGTLDSLERFAAQRARILALDAIPRALNSLMAVMDAHPGTDKALRAASRIISLAFKKDPWMSQSATGRARSSETGQCSPLASRAPADFTPMPKASTVVATGRSRSEGPWNGIPNRESVRPDGAGEPQHPATTGVAGTRPPVATIAQPSGLSDPAPQAASLKTQDSLAPSASWISTARFTAADILDAVGAPRAIEPRPRSRAPT